MLLHLHEVWLMANDKKRGLLEQGAEKTGEVLGEIGQKGLDVVKSFEKGLKKGLSKGKKEK